MVTLEEAQPTPPSPSSPPQVVKERPAQRASLPELSEDTVTVARSLVDGVHLIQESLLAVHERETGASRPLELGTGFEERRFEVERTLGRLSSSGDVPVNDKVSLIFAGTALQRAAVLRFYGEMDKTDKAILEMGIMGLRSMIRKITGES